MLGKIDDPPVASSCSNDSYEQFFIHTVKRLLRAHQLYINNRAYIEDYYLALRDYLVYYHPSLCIDDFDETIGEKYGIRTDPSTGNLFATYSEPSYMHKGFLKATFFENTLNESNYGGKNYNLETDPMIYRLTNYSAYKSLEQKLAVVGALRTPEGYTTLVALPTGGGKSLITQALSYQKEGLTIAVVPTISLAIDQCRAAKKRVQSGSVDQEIFYYSSGENSAPIIKAIDDKTARLLFISPEALLNNNDFVKAIAKANKNKYLKNIVIDEAHIVVDWGDFFRIDYQCLESWRNKILLSNPAIRTILLSATFEKQSVSLLKQFFGKDNKWIEIRCDELRHEPRFVLVDSKDETEKNTRIVELVRKLPHPMILYVARPSDAEEYRKLLKKNGIHNVKTFTGETPNAKRRALIEEWVDDSFEIMVATSAFGIGVDKPDVRTVIHAYLPSNPNAYYQELGRGGRDGLPCLSVMCITNNDLQVSFQRINKRVMTTEKIIGRWISLYENPKSKRIDNIINIDTSIKPSYSEDNLFDDMANNTDINWNIYVLLFLRRNGFIDIKEVLKEEGRYVFVISIVDDQLRKNNDNLTAIIEEARAKEWNHYNQAYQQMKYSVMNAKTRCWSEMFYETYDRVLEFCAGCMNHDEIIKDDVNRFPLKKPIPYPRSVLTTEQQQLFSGSTNVFVNICESDVPRVLSALLTNGVSIFVNAPDFTIITQTTNKNANCLDFLLLRELVQRNCNYYVSGVVVVFYHGNETELFDQYCQVADYLINKPDLFVIHLLEKDVVFKELDKRITDILEGPVISAETLCAHLGG